MLGENQTQAQFNFVRGQLWVCSFDTHIKPRPVLLVSVADRMATRLGIAPITTQKRRINAATIPIMLQGAERLIKVHNTSFIKSKDLKRCFGLADATTMQAVDKGLKALFTLENDATPQDSSQPVFGEIYSLEKGCFSFTGADRGRPVLIVGDMNVAKTGMAHVMPFNSPGYAYADKLDVGLPWTVAPMHLKEVHRTFLKKEKIGKLDDEGIARTKAWLSANFGLGFQQGSLPTPV